MSSFRSKRTGERGNSDPESALFGPIFGGNVVRALWWFFWLIIIVAIVFIVLWVLYFSVTEGYFLVSSKIHRGEIRHRRVPRKCPKCKKLWEEIIITNSVIPHSLLIYGCLVEHHWQNIKLRSPPQWLPLLLGLGGVPYSDQKEK